MIDNAAGLRQLVLPAGAQPGTPRIVMGPDIPAELVTWGAAGGHGVVFFAVEIFYYDATQYVFHAIGSFSGNTCYFEGTYDPTNTVYITKRDVLGGISPGSVDIRIGSSTLNTFQATYLFQKIAVMVDSDASLAVLARTPFSIDGVSAARGLVDRVSSIAATGAIGAEAVVLTGNTITWWPGRAYEVYTFTQPFGSIANNTAQYRLRRHNILGAVLANRSYQMSPSPGFTQCCENRTIIRNNTGASITENLVMTLDVPGGGTVTDYADTMVVRYIEIRDCGAASDYPNAIQI